MQDADTLTTDAVRRGMPANMLFARLPARVVATLTSEQKDAIRRALGDPAWRHPPVNVRLSLPLLGGRYFLTILGGRERRSATRLAHERRTFPLGTVANFGFFLCLGVLIYAIALFGIYLHGTLNTL